MSPPCQPFSTTREAKQRDIKDKRCAALEHLCGVLPRLPRPPRWIALENVKGFYGSEACVRWRAALAEAGFTHRQLILDLMSFGTPNHRTRYYLLAERSPRFREAVSAAGVPSLGACLTEAVPILPPGVLARGPWARQRRSELDAAHAAARALGDASSGDAAAALREAKERVFRQARRDFCGHLAALLRGGGAEGDGDGGEESRRLRRRIGELSSEGEVELAGSLAWKLLPLPRNEPDALLLVFDEDGQEAARRLLALLQVDDSGTSSSSTSTPGVVTWSMWPPPSLNVSGAGHEARRIGDFLQAAESMTPEEQKELLVSQEVLSKPYAHGLSYVGQKDARSFCFTGHYGKVMHKSSGSLLHLPGPGGEEMDKANPASAFGAVRFFSPKEIINFLGFPAAYALPSDMLLKHRYKVVGNSIAVTVCSKLLELLLLGQGDELISALEQPPPTKPSPSELETPGPSSLSEEVTC
ncbi:unnamed protein product [Polarella glacialis]|uniref:DNA (cytosine-5-)-methyltransferase n=1 Tax=Polarella glacialis TaxID=89957 RepID=A0A813EPB5_POLGL|nr:unnamed protein product [Polarella glacialis]